MDDRCREAVPCASLRRMIWPPHDTYPYDDDPFPPRRDRQRERLRHLVFLDGRLVDTWTELVEATVYRELAESFDQERSFRHIEPTPFPPPYERVLTWLDATVGGRVALLALDDEPLVDQQPRAERPAEERARAAEVVTGFLALAARELFDPEFLLATRAALATVRREDPDLLHEAPAIEVASGLIWLLGRANGVVGTGTGVTQQALKRLLETSVSPSRRVPRLRSCLRGLAAEPDRRPTECPDLLELGNPGYLTSATRRRLIGLRDRALAAAESAEADQQARGTPATGRVDNLTS